MRKIHTLLCLILLLAIVIFADMAFGNPLKETFKGIDMSNYGSELNYKYDPNESKKINPGFLAAVPPNYTFHSDDQPSYFGFSFF